MKKIAFFALFSTLCCFLLSAQSADKVTEMIAAKNVTFNQAAYFAASYLALGSADMSDAEAAKILTETVHLPKLKNTEAPLSFQDFAYVCLEVWNIRGGINYRIFKSPRYALKELKALRFVPVLTDPGVPVNGREVLHIMQKCAAYVERNNLAEEAQ